MCTSARLWPRDGPDGLLGLSPSETGEISMKRIRNVDICLAGLLLTSVMLSLSLQGQTTLGVIAGTVTDSSGAVVVGANVTLERIEGGEPRVATTGPTGDYRFESLTPGKFRHQRTHQH